MGMVLGRTGPTHFRIRMCGWVAWKAATTMVVLASTVEMQIVKVTPKAAGRTTRVRGPG